MNHILLKIKEIYEELDVNERKIADYMLNDLDKIIELPIRLLSEESGASQAAWVRFCKMIGYSGLKDLKRDYILNVRGQVKSDLKEMEQTYTDIQGYEKIEDIIANVSYLNQKSIEDTRLILDANALQAAADAISQAKRVAILGMGASALVAQDAAYKFLRIGVNSLASLDFHMQLTSTSLLDSEDIVIIISYSGRTKEMVECLDIAKSRGCKTICITKYGKNPISNMSDIVLSLSAAEIEKRSGAMGSRIAQLNVIDILFTAVANQKYELVKPILEQTSNTTKLHRI
ncbi:MurR/RpiR family transcriptional regulator [Turicibacter sanguinis]|uniref:MurR/RpiR family transcriptional regulator n=1 Tax=Turicibacter sanguinis TaxID=154288 RepID=UPI0021D48E2E|nr:MurR/RpiR family transcriptional regulator [Turicibacter sanguinis]MCU7202503.1 MurR/RpiR family transcriptional regulator [Turicibacter sanguinis]